MASLTRFHAIPVEILDVCEDGAGVFWASVETVDGSRPFVMGLREPVFSSFGLVPVSELTFGDRVSLFPAVAVLEA